MTRPIQGNVGNNLETAWDTSTVQCNLKQIEPTVIHNKICEEKVILQIF